ncbi:MAG: ligase-associated DNA damage response endonuclease PdeM [Verrucomicrobiaceae bacterium]|nr:ligase-associated DNA damage response endonuclease PdeM [Verrucomicrobiaceae bacterium]
MLAIRHGSNDLQLLPEGAAFDARRGLLFVSDLHLGKTAVFRDAGLALPEGPDDRILTRLTELTAKTSAKSLVVLGDVFHAKSPGTQQVVEKLAQHRGDVKWLIVPGNHDKRVPWADWLPDAEILDEGDLVGPWRVRHFPPEDTVEPTLCGHLHPGIALGAARVRKTKLPCFWQRREALVLPAFGDFTGLKMIQREPDDRVWVTINDQIAEVPRRA